MKLSMFLLIKAIVALIFAVALLVLPAQMGDLWEMSYDAGTLLMARYAGLGLLAIGLLCWFMKDARPSDYKQNLLLSLFVVDTLGFIIALYYQLNNTVGAFGWINVILWLLLALGLAYFRFIKPETA